MEYPNFIPIMMYSIEMRLQACIRKSITKDKPIKLNDIFLVDNKYGLRIKRSSNICRLLSHFGYAYYKLDGKKLYAILPLAKQDYLCAMQKDAYYGHRAMYSSVQFDMSKSKRMGNEVEKDFKDRITNVYAYVPVAIIDFTNMINDKSVNKEDVEVFYDFLSDATRAANEAFIMVTEMNKPLANSYGSLATTLGNKSAYLSNGYKFPYVPKNYSGGFNLFTKHLGTAIKSTDFLGHIRDIMCPLEEFRHIDKHLESFLVAEQLKWSSK